MAKRRTTERPARRKSTGVKPRDAAAKAKKTARSAARGHSPRTGAHERKIDPLLSLLIRRRSEKTAERVRGQVAAPGAITPQSGSWITPASGSHITPASMRDVPIGRQLLFDQLSAKATQEFAKECLVPVLIEVDQNGSLADAERKIANGKGRTLRLSKRTIAAWIPPERIASLARIAQVRRVEPSVRLEPKLDAAHLSAHCLSAAGAPLVPETGKNVLVGIVDTGIDAAHPAFAKSGGSNPPTRIVDYLDQTSGRRYTSADISSGQASASPDEVGHGTHVAGIAAGSRLAGAEGKFRGVAPDAELAIVKTTFDSVDIAAGVAHIFDVATQLNQPCVVNLSLGGHFGGHDGSTVVERTIDELSGHGRIVVVAAGNEGAAHLHASTVLRANNPRWTADLELRARVIDGVQSGLLYAQVWHQREDDIAIVLRSPSGETFSAPVGGSQDFDRGQFFVQAAHARAPYSDDHNTTFIIATVPQPQWLSGWSIIATPGVNGTTVGAVHAWILQSGMGRFTTGAVESHLVGMPGTAFSAVTVASYATRKAWTSSDPTNTNVNLDAINLENISYFSSPGPTRDGNNKPEIAAPGQWLISALSANASEDELPLWLRVRNTRYAAMQGTSMATPYVTGAIALLLQKYPDLDYAEVKRRLMKSAKSDGFTTPCWNERWGYGKIDVERLLTIEPT